jgi:hypothetical protein
MNFEFDPFSGMSPSGQGPITSITLITNLDWLALPTEPITGDQAVIPINAETDTPALRVFATGSAIGTPAMRALLPSHIPNIEISQVNGLQAQLDSVFNSLVSSHASLTVTNNGLGGYTLTPNFGNTASTFAIGNDNRFPASVVGLRKGAGGGALDLAAVPKVDYWDTTEFKASGGLHSKGLVPDPGTFSGSTRFLREDATWATPAGSGTVTSVALAMPSEFSVAGSPGTSIVNLAVTKVAQPNNTFFAGPTIAGSAAPTFRAHVYGDLAALVGTGSSTIAAGNDTRFPANVTGLRKSAGAGSTDLAAVLGTDYWNGDVFGGKGPSSKKGLVPDPGGGAAPYGRYLREDATWQAFTPAAGSIDPSAIVPMAAKTLIANATAGLSSPAIVDAKTARSSSLLNLESITSFGNADYPAVSTDRYTKTTAAFTAPRSVTLPLANSFNSGQIITISDDFAAINSTNVLKIARQGADLIQGSSAPLIMSIPKGSYSLVSDGISQWSVINRHPSVARMVVTSNATYNTPTGVKFLFVECIGAGGGGGGAQAVVSQCSIGGGGGAGGYANAVISNPSASYVMTIGSGGGGGVGNAAGSGGGVTSFGSVVIAQSGNGGSSLAAGTTPNFVAAGTGGTSTGDMQSQGSSGGLGVRQSGTMGRSGDGAAAGIFCGAISGLFAADADGNSSGSGYGGGGGGAISYSTASKTGGAGRQGVIIVTEYY